MKKSIFVPVILSIGLAMALPAVSHADEDSYAGVSIDEIEGVDTATYPSLLAQGYLLPSEGSPGFGTPSDSYSVDCTPAPGSNTVSGSGDSTAFVENQGSDVITLPAPPKVDFSAYGEAFNPYATVQSNLSLGGTTASGNTTGSSDPIYYADEEQQSFSGTIVNPGQTHELTMSGTFSCQCYGGHL